MNLSLNWLRELIDLPANVENTIQQDVTMKVAEIEEIENQVEKYSGMVVGEIKKIKEHPNADKLKMAIVDSGKKEPFTVICGAPNIEQGQKVVFAQPGALIGNDEIEETIIRGVKSHGMILSERELGISDDHSGIMVLDSSLKPGSLVTKALGLNDTILHIDNHAITHRPDLWCHRGMTRELAAVYGLKLPEELDPSIQEKGQLNIEIEDRDLCSRYTGAIVENVRIKESPAWLKNRLNACGIRPIYNIVDITNLVMLEVGEPMHAFDADKVKDRHIIVRRAKEGESITTLDEQERSLTPENLVIADPEKAVALAGVMGGKNTEISSSSTAIILEAATFDHANIRKTRIATGLKSEATNRFEKNLVPEITAIAINRAIALIKELIPNAEVTAIRDVDYNEYKKKIVRLTGRNIKRITGTDISLEQGCSILSSLGFMPKDINENECSIEVPYWRNRDTNIEVDLIEDIARIYGLDRIQPVLPCLPNVPTVQPCMRILEKRLRNMLSGAGADEIYTYSFSPESFLQMFSIPQEDPFELDNPLDSTMRKMRQSLLPGMLEGVKKNSGYLETFTLYEIGRTYNKKTLESENLHENETMMLSLLTYAKNAEVMYYDARRFLDIILKGFNLPYRVERKTDIPDMHPGRTGSVYIENTPIGYIAELRPRITDQLKLHGRIGVVELQLDALLEFVRHRIKEFEPVPKFPSILREFSMICPEELDFAQIYETVLPLNELIREVHLLNIYQGPPIDNGKKSVSFRVILQDFTKTLSDEEANEIQDVVLETLNKKLNIVLRKG